MTDDQMSRLQQAVSNAQASEVDRVRVITEVHNEGVSLREIAKALGMTHPGIRKIVQRSERK